MIVSGRLMAAALERARRNLDAGEWLDPAAPEDAIAEASFAEPLHPRDRLGRWRDVWNLPESPGRPARHELGWAPGGTGKGFVLEDGSVWTWPTKDYRPMHMAKDYTRRHRGLPRPVPKSAFHISESGRVFFIGEGRGHDAATRARVRAADPRLHYDGDAPRVTDTAHAAAILAATREQGPAVDEVVGVTPVTHPAASPRDAMAFATTREAREFRARVQADLRSTPEVTRVTSAEGPGVFGGESEYSWTLGLAGPHDAIERLAVGWARDFGQEQVALARLEPDGPHHVWTWQGVDRDAAVAAMERAGVFGGTLTGGNLSIFDKGDLTPEQITSLSDALGVSASERPATVRFLDRRPDGTYREAEAGEGADGAGVPDQRAAAPGDHAGPGGPAAPAAPEGPAEAVSPGRPRWRLAESPGRPGPKLVTADELWRQTLPETLPEDERRAVVAYTNSSQGLSDADHEALARVVARHPLPGPVRLERKVAPHELDGLAAGDVVTEDRFISTSIGYSGIGGRSDDFGTLRLDVPAGVPAYANPWNYEESEVILAPGTRLRIDDVRRSINGRPDVRATALA